MAPNEPFTIEVIIRALDRTAFSPTGALLISLYSFYKARSIYGPYLTWIEYVRSQKWLKWLLVWVGIKTVNRSLVRLVMNHGWKSDPPSWSRVKNQGDVILVTGGAQGIGMEVVKILAKKTNKIAVLDMAPPLYPSHLDVQYYKCDVTDSKAIAEVATQVREKLGHPTVLLNNAGIIRGKKILDTTPEEFLLTYKVNVLGCHNILREFLPHLIAINHGHVMTVASAASYASVCQLAEYSCSKSAVLALHETLRGELQHRYSAPNVRTSIICPTKVSTLLGATLNDQDMQFMTPTLTPTWVARRMVEVIEAGLSDHVVAPSIPAFLLPKLRSMPEWFRWLVDKTGKTHATVTDAGVGVAHKKYGVAYRNLEEAHRQSAAKDVISK